jgi:hypothetical protein
MFYTFNIKNWNKFTVETNFVSENSKTDDEAPREASKLQHELSSFVPFGSPFVDCLDLDPLTSLFSDPEHFSSVADPEPDPYVFGPPGSGSISTTSGSGSIYLQAKIVRKALFCDFFMTFYL